MVVDGFSGGTRGAVAPLFFCYDTRSSKAHPMPVNLEVKGMLAKCLAMENIIIEHKKVQTAMFDVERRVLTLPTWDKASNTVYDLLVAHEVGHSLATPNVDWTIDYPDVPKDFVNILEDVRVEKLMKKKYGGLSRTFFNGYQELHNEDFFCTKDEDLNKLSYIDRMNLYFKVGAFLCIDFTDEENEFLTRASLTETFDDVLKLARDIVEFVKYKQKKVAEMPSQGNSNEDMSGSGEEVETPQPQGQEGQGENKDGEGQESQGDNQLDQQSQSQSSSNEESFGDDVSKSLEAPKGSGSNGKPSDTHGDPDVDELNSKTSKSFDEKAKELVDKTAAETAYVELPEFNLEHLIIPNDYIHQKAKEQVTANDHSRMLFGDSVKQYQKYKKSAEKEVSYLVKEFECKKSADQYARSSTARTGVLDTAKLHTYKFNEDLFKKVSVVPDGKNHGLIFVFDWSGSMANFILDAYKQLLNLVWFCRKVNIPFEVYAFTLDCNSYVDIQPNHPSTYKKVSSVICPEQGFRMLNLLTSKVNNNVLEEQLKHIWTVCSANQGRQGVYLRHLDLSGSPIGESILSLHAIIPQFQQKNKLQKVNVIFLTDGEGYVNAVTTEKQGYGANTYMGTKKYYSTSIRDRKSGRVYRSYGYDNFAEYAKILLETVKDKFPWVNLINFRITPSRDFYTCYRWYGDKKDVVSSSYLDTNEDYKKAKSLFTKNNFITFDNTGFDQFNVIASDSLSQNSNFVVPDDATASQVKTAFVKMLGKKKTNRKLLSNFISLVS